MQWYTYWGQPQPGMNMQWYTYWGQPQPGMNMQWYTYWGQPQPGMNMQWYTYWRQPQPAMNMQWYTYWRQPQPGSAGRLQAVTRTGVPHHGLDQRCSELTLHLCLRMRQMSQRQIDDRALGERSIECLSGMHELAVHVLYRWSLQTTNKSVIQTYH